MITYKWILGHIDIISLFIDFLSLIVTILLTVVIYRLERKHDKEHDKVEEQARKIAIEEAARVFLIDNDEEIEYLLLSEVASQVKLKRKHCHQITNRYLRCSEQVQKEILRQANISSIEVSIQRANKSLELLKEDIAKYNFGKDILYDGAKYFHRAFERWSDVPINVINPYIFKNIQTTKQCENKLTLLGLNETSLFSYMWDYLHCDEYGIEREQLESPIDMVFHNCKLGTCKESDMTFWTMRIILDSCHTFKPDNLADVFDENLIRTQEDMYYYTIAVLCRSYPITGDEK